MDFERARSTEQLNKRRDDIKSACISIYDKEGFEAVNLKRISEMTTIKRSTIYNYYRTKEEILIDILADEIVDWMGDLTDMKMSYEEHRPKTDGNDMQGRAFAFAEQFTNSIVKRDRMVQLYSILFTLLEPGCRIEKLVEFKIPALQSSALFAEILQKAFPEYDGSVIAEIANQILCFVLGLYPMSHLSEKQEETLKLLGGKYCVPDYQKTCIDGIAKICIFEND